MITTRPTPIQEIIQLFPGIDEIQFEQKLELENFPLFKLNGDTEIKDCDTYLKIGAYSANRKIINIPTVCLLQLFNEATRLRKYGTGYITALKMSYGVALTSPPSISILFQPICLWAQSPTANPQYFDIIEGSYFVFENNTFRLAFNSEKNILSQYKNLINFRHYGDATPQPYRNNDTLSSTFPFQEIFTLMYDNISEDEIVIYNSIRKDVNDIRHSLLLSPNLPEPFDKDFNGKYANRAYLCPPDCERLTYKLA